MNTYDHWVTETVANHAVNPAPKNSTLGTLEFARFQMRVDAPAAEPGLLARLRAFLFRR